MNKFFFVLNPRLWIPTVTALTFVPFIIIALDLQLSSEESNGLGSLIQVNLMARKRKKKPIASTSSSSSEVKEGGMQGPGGHEATVVDN